MPLTALIPARTTTPGPARLTLPKGVYGHTNGRTQQPTAVRRANRRARNKIAKASRRVNRGGR
jgi:hypothetical protein